MSYLDTVLCMLKNKWAELMSSLLDGSCGCLETITVYYALPEFVDCEGCTNKEVTEELRVAVF